MKKIFPRLFTVSLGLVSTLLIISPFYWSARLASSLILLLSIVIILLATYFATREIVIFSSAAVLAIFWYSLRASQFALWPMLLLALSLGIFYSYCLHSERFGQRASAELDSVEEQRNILGVEIEHARLEQNTLKQKLHRYTTLKALIESLGRAPSFDALNSLIITETFRIIGKSSACLLYLVDKEKEQLNLLSNRMVEYPEQARFPFDQKAELSDIKKGDIFDNWVFKQRNRLMISDTMRDFRFNIQDMDSQNIRNVRSLISVPLIRENKFLGIIRLDNTAKEAYDADDLRLLDIIANLAAITIENIMLYEEKEKLAITDGLSGLFVHRYFQERFDEEISRAIWTDSQFALLILDIDNFKTYNDRYGHIAGDIVLKQIARLISLTVNPGDIVARYGGEEFAVLLVETNKQEAIDLAEQIRARIEEEKFILRREGTRVSISGGMSFFPENDREKVSLIREADQALYKAKLEGKNRICTS